MLIFYLWLSCFRCHKMDSKTARTLSWKHQIESEIFWQIFFTIICSPEKQFPAFIYKVFYTLVHISSSNHFLIVWSFIPNHRLIEQTLCYIIKTTCRLPMYRWVFAVLEHKGYFHTKQSVTQPRTMLALIVNQATTMWYKLYDACI